MNEDMTMTPIAAQVLLHCYYACGPYPDDTPAVRGAYSWLEQRGLITDSVGGMDLEPWQTTTDKGQVLVKAMLSTPMPRWEVPTGTD
jgi:hypothetical protein